MDLPVLKRVAYDGDRRIEFQAAVLAAATTQRPGSERWTELTVYRTQIRDEEPPQGLYIAYRVGRSLVAHRARCPKQQLRGMPPFAEDPAGPRRVPCMFCLPVLDPPEEGAVMERTKHTLHRCRAPEDLERVIFPQRDAQRLRGMTADAVGQLRQADQDFDYWWDVAVAPVLNWD